MELDVAVVLRTFLDHLLQDAYELRLSFNLLEGFVDEGDVREQRRVSGSSDA